ILIILGVLAGVLLHVTKADHSKYVPKFTDKLFFYCLLPPIILESAYSLYDRYFFMNVISILIYAVVGTLINVALIGGSLFACSALKFFQNKVPFAEILLFATLISAVDPVAVLAIFQEIKVNKPLYFLVFGESLLNDAVVITVYNVVSVFTGPKDLNVVDILKAIVSFVIVSIGGFTFGCIMGAITSIITKYTKGVRVMEPLLVILLAYVAYCGAELFHFSGIISIIGCGLIQAEYARHNVSRKSYTATKYITQTLSSIADTIIFIFLGIVLIRDNHYWDTSFVLLTTIFCVVYRFAGVFLLTFLLNLSRKNEISIAHQVIMAYGGLRGAIAFSLCITMSDTVNHESISMFTTTTLVVILFTVFVLGSTTKPIVRCLRVKTQTTGTLDAFMEIHDKVLNESINGVESVTGQRSLNYWVLRAKRFNEIYVKRYLIRNHSATSKALKETYDKIFKEGMISKMTTSDFYNKMKSVQREMQMNEDYGAIDSIPNITIANGHANNGSKVHPSIVTRSESVEGNVFKRNGTANLTARVNTISRFKATLILQPEDLSPNTKRPPSPSNNSNIFFKRS
ncbi:Na(+)/H(+) exchanger protein 7-like protein, partial [Leptotrombidium deliense]